MDLLERYLQAVRFFLPRRHQDDIVRELSDNLLSQFEDREEELGRPLSQDEQSEILRRHGHPMVVAGRYGSRQHLIGPAFFPVYLFTLKAGLAVALLITVVLAAVAAILTGEAWDSVVRAARAYPGRALMVFACTTLAFAVLDELRTRFRLCHAWDPRTLPKLVRSEHRMPRLESLFEFVFAVAALVWLLLIPGSPWLIMGPAAAFLDAAPVWGTVFVPMVILMASTAGLSLFNFLRPYWTPARSLIRAGLHLGSFALFAVLLRAGEWVTAKPGVTLPHGTRIVEVINAGCEVFLFFGGVIAAVQLFLELRRRVRRHGPPPRAAAIKVSR